MTKRRMISVENLHITTPLKMTENTHACHTLHPCHGKIHLILHNLLTTRNANILSLHRNAHISHFSRIIAAIRPSKNGKSYKTKCNTTHILPYFKTAQQTHYTTRIAVLSLISSPTYHTQNFTHHHLIFFIPIPSFPIPYTGLL